MTDWVDDYLWGGGYVEQGRAYYPPPPGPTHDRIECTKCGKPVPLDDHIYHDGLPYHHRCLSARFLHPEQRP